MRESLHEREEKLKTMEEANEKKDQRIDELQRLLGGMEQESASLREAIRSREEELHELSKIREAGQKGDQRSVITHKFTHTLIFIKTGNQTKILMRCIVNLCVDFFRAEQLEKELAILKEKIHHLDDMLKSQQRKVRHMIEQVRRTCVKPHRANAQSPCPYLCRICAHCLTVCLLIFSSRTLAW